MLLPGLTFRRFYYTEEFSKEYFKESFIGIFISSFIPSVVLHAIWIYNVQHLGYIVDFVLLGTLLTDVSRSSPLFLNIQNYSANIFYYNITLLIFSSALGYLSKKIIRIWKWDRKIKLFRFKNSWHYVITGEFFEFPSTSMNLNTNKVEDIELVYCDTLVETSEGAIIYDGILVDYELSKAGGLSSISLTNVERRFISEDKRKESYSIPGHILIIPNESIINVNFSYYKLEENKDEYIVKMVD
ncbi:MAG: hypothetical protein L3J06_10765 [Cyclobacteriaceae bacterium]|nr:hypothetical protein [Cyclobacteriaceae bacterium]